MPQAKYGLRHRRSGYRSLAVKRRRRPYKSRRRFKGKSYRRRGVRFTGRRSRIYAPLKANFAVNDYRRLKFNVDQASFSLATSYVAAVEVRTLSLNDLAFGQSTTDAGDFTQFKITNLQLVIEPLDKVNGDRHLEVNVIDIPYLAIRFVSDSSTTSLNPNRDDLRQTPGYTYIPINRTKRSVLNTRPIIEKETQLVGNTFNTLHRTYIDMPWMDINFSAGGTHTFPVIRAEILRPSITAQSYAPQYDVSWYGDLLLRGRKVQVIAPDT